MRRFERATALAAAAILPLALCSCAIAPAGDAPAATPAEQLDTARAAVAADAGDPESWFRLGLAWQRRAKADSAIAAYDHALELDPAYVKAIVHSGLVLEDLGRFDQALAKYERASEIAPRDPLPYVDKGSVLYFQFKKTYEAKVALTKALELDPDNADAHFNLGVLFADAGMFGEARVEWEKVLEVAPDGPARTLAQENLQRILPALEGKELSTGDTGAEP